jgi:hypothetical protein
VFMGVLRKKIETYSYSEIFFLEILINVKAGRVNWGAALDRPAVERYSAGC